jgi:DNA-binding transcriptional LysR family regulator
MNQKDGRRCVAREVESPNRRLEPVQIEALAIEPSVPRFRMRHDERWKEAQVAPSAERAVDSPNEHIAELVVVLVRDSIARAPVSIHRRSNPFRGSVELERREVAMAEIGLLRGADAGLKTSLLFEASPVLVARTSHAVFAKRASPGLAALCSHRWLLPPPNDPARERIAALFLDADLEPPNPAITCGDLPLAMSIALQADYLIMVPSDVAQFAIAGGAFRMVPIALPGQRDAIGVIQRRDLVDAPEAASLVECLRLELGRAGIERRRPAPPRR